MPTGARPPRGPRNVPLRAGVIAPAKEVGLNISGFTEAAVAQAVKATEQAAWLAENEEAIEHYNAWVEKYGLFSDKYRKF